jgi:rhomboid family GlyGly-CTERM serine protease
VCVLLATGSAAAWWLPAPWLDWQPAQAAQAWRWWTAGFVHWSPLHLAANAAGLLAVALLGRAAALPAAAAVAWALAWPLTHGALLARPALAHYGGLSGVLHAGVAVAAAWLLVAGRGRRRAIGAAIAAVLALKLAGERPLGPLLQQPAGWDIAVAPLAHLTGAVAGFVLGAVAAVWAGRAGWRSGR